MEGAILATILQKFVEAEAKYGDERFYLLAFRKNELDAVRDRVRHVGTVPLGDDDVWYIVAPMVDASSGIEVPLIEHREELVELAAEAGAALPMTVRQGLPCEPWSPANCWLSHLLLSNPQCREVLNNQVKDGEPFRLVCDKPFLASIQAIHRLQETIGRVESVPAARQRSGLIPRSVSPESGAIQDYFNVIHRARYVLTRLPPSYPGDEFIGPLTQWTIGDVLSYSEQSFLTAMELQVAAGQEAARCGQLTAFAALSSALWKAFVEFHDWAGSAPLEWPERVKYLDAHGVTGPLDEAIQNMAHVLEALGTNINLNVQPESKITYPGEGGVPMQATTRKRSTTKGEAQDKLISAFLAWHKYYKW